MGVFDKLLKKMGPSWCKDCKTQTDIIKKQLYFIPITVSQKLPDEKDYQYLLSKLVPINDKSEIPAGFCAALLKRFRCPSCSKKRDYLELFLPVRNEERFLAGYHYKNGELDSIKTF